MTTDTSTLTGFITGRPGDYNGVQPLRLGAWVTLKWFDVTEATDDGFYGRVRQVSGTVLGFKDGGFVVLDNGEEHPIHRVVESVARKAV